MMDSKGNNIFIFVYSFQGFLHEEENNAPLCYVLPFILREFPQKMLRNVLTRLTHLEVSLEFPDTLKMTGGLY